MLSELGNQMDIRTKLYLALTLLSLAVLFALIIYLLVVT